jgi:hypothetical protein
MQRLLLATVVHNILQCSTVQYSTVQYNTVSVKVSRLSEVLKTSFAQRAQATTAYLAAAVAW